MYQFIETTNLDEFESFVKNQNGSYLQSSNWPKVKVNWKSHFYSGYFNDEICLTALVLERKIKGIGKLFYISCGSVSDYHNEVLQTEFADFLKKEMKKYHAFATIIDPLIPIRISDIDQEEGHTIHRLLTNIGYVINDQIDSYTYKNPVQTLIDLENATMDDLMKSFEKGVRYSIRIAETRGLDAKRYTYEDILKDESIMDDFILVMNDTMERNDFFAKDKNYLKNLIKNFADCTDVSLVYYDKNLDSSKMRKEQTEKERLESLKEKVNPTEQIHLQKEIDQINKNLDFYHERLEECKNQPDRFVVAGGITLRYGNTATCLFGGTRNIIRNNVRSSQYLNYLRIKESLNQKMKYHDLGYVLVENPSLNADGTLGRMIPKENFKGICSFKKSFGAKYYEYIGEYVLVNNSFKYWLYHRLIHKAKEILKQLKKAKSN